MSKSMKPNVLHVAAKAIIVNQNNQVLVLRQSDPTISGHKQCHPPGGMLELGESIYDCVAREVEEEIGVTPKVNGIIDVGEWRAERGDTRMQFVGVFFECTIEETDFELQNSEVSEAVWVGLDDIDDAGVLEPAKSVVVNFLKKRSE